MCLPTHHYTTRSKALGSRSINTFFRGIYQNDVFIPGPVATDLCDGLRVFIKCYLWQAHHSFHAGVPGFGLYPKLHGLHEVQHKMARQIRLHGFAWNPAADSCSIDEDFIGRCAALSRTVSPKLSARRVIERYLCHIQIGWARKPLKPLSDVS